MPHLSPTQRHQTLVEWNDTQPHLDFKVGLHHLARTSALRHGSAVAVDDGQQHLTFGDVVRLASGLAARLRRLGVGSEDLVALYLEPTVAITWTALGVLEAGAACLPLDPLDSARTLSSILVHAAPRVVLSTAALSTDLAEGPWTVLDIQTVQPVISPPPLLDPTFSPHRLAYVLYSPSSSGRITGEELPHRLFTNLACCARQIFGLHPGVRTSQVAEVSSRLSIWEIWASLASAAQLHVAPLAARRSEQALHTWRVRKKIEVSVAPRTEISSLGTALHPESGRPLPGTRLYVLDPSLQPVAVGSTGQIFLAGIPLPRGYRGNRAHTAGCFVPNPFEEVLAAPDDGSYFSDGRLFRTGTWGRLCPDGTLQLLA